jgi:hypothetical protein
VQRFYANQVRANDHMQIENCLHYFIKCIEFYSNL